MPTVSATRAAALLPPNYVWRSYLGGQQLRRFRGRPDVPDDHFPEDWLASTVKARNGSNSHGPCEGLSTLAWSEGESAGPRLSQPQHAGSADVCEISRRPSLIARAAAGK